MRDLTLEEIFHDAAKEGVAWCHGITPTGHYCGRKHDQEGSIDRDGIHFRDRRSSPANTLAFLKLIAQANDPSLNEDEPWRRVYRLNIEVRRLSHLLGIRNPAHPALGDRAFVLASVAGLGNDVPMRKQAFDWARRGPRKE